MDNTVESVIRVGETGRSGDLDRSLHLVDIENLVGEPTSWRPDRIRATFDAYLQTATWRPGDSLVVAAADDETTEPGARWLSAGRRRRSP